MNKIATCSFKTVDVPLSVDQIPAGYQATLFLGTLPAGAPVDVQPDVEFTFPITLPGDYHIEVVRLDTKGVPCASPVSSDTQTVQPDMVTVPLSVSFVLKDATVSVPGDAVLAVA